jgi:hypothetical protein
LLITLSGNISSSKFEGLYFSVKSWFIDFMYVYDMFTCYMINALKGFNDK